MKKLMPLFITVLIFAQSVEHEAHLMWGPCDDVEVSDGDIYAASGSHILHFGSDMSMTRSERLNLRIKDIEIIDGEVLALTRNGIVFRETELFRISGRASSIAGSGGNIFGTSDDGLYKYDGDSLILLSTDAYSAITASDDQVICFGERLELRDSDGALLDDIDCGDMVSDIAVSEGRVIAVRDWMYAELFTISETSISSTLTISPGNIVTNCAISGDRLALTSMNGDIWKYDLSDLSGIEPYEHINRDMFFGKAAWKAEELFVASLYDGLYRFGSTEENYLTPSGAASDFVSYGENTFCAFGPGGLVNLDRTGEILSVIDGEYISSIERLGDILYAVEESFGILVFDLSLSSEPELTYSLEMTGRTNSLELVEALSGIYYLYSIDFMNNLAVISLENPLEPAVVWTTDIMRTSPTALDQVWSLLAITTLYSVEVYDNLFFPESPRWMNRIESDEEIKDIASSDDIIAIAKEDVVDIYRLGYTVPFGTFLSSISEIAEGIEIDENCLLIMSDWGISLYDITAPEIPIYLTTINIPGKKAIITNDLLLTGNFYDGVDISSWDNNPQFTLSPGWNLVGLPFEAEGLPHSSVGIFRFTEREYEAVESPTAGTGYFWFAESPFQCELSGTFSDTFEIAFEAGWNIATFPKKRLNAELIPSVGPVYGYEEGVYEEKEILSAGKSYWVLVEREMTIRFSGNSVSILSAGKSAANAGNPPPPPSSDIIKPKIIEMLPIYPNPFNSSTCLTVDIPETENVVIELYAVDGRKAGTYFEGELPPGKNSIRIHDDGNLSSGVYLLRAHIGDKTITRKIILSK